MTLPKEQSHYLSTVLRIKNNQTIILFNGSGGQFEACITDVSKKTVSVKILDFTPDKTESLLSIELGQGISRGERMDYTIQKSVELGVSSITPLFTQRCNVKLNDDRLQKRVDHWTKVMISAGEQSGRCILPTINPPQLLHDWFRSLEKENNRLRLICDPCASNKISTLRKSLSVSLCIGPEGGLTNDEIKQAIQSGFSSITLGPRILRTETAAITALSVLQALWGDL